MNAIATIKTSKDVLLKQYADWRVGATLPEKRAHKASNSILLTFDDYGSKAQVESLLSILAAERVRAMFFIQGNWAQRHPDLVRAIARAGHIVGNHTFSHPDLLGLTLEQVRAEIEAGPRSQWLRPPRGRYNAKIRELAHQLGYRICYWSIDSNDWQGVPAEYITSKVVGELHPGAVILFHINAPNTLQALPCVIQGIKARGYELTSMEEPEWG